MNPVQHLLTENIGLWTGADTAKKSGRGRASGSVGTAYGIKKLRELILELAVHGKLLPQDANDQPASALLQQIRAEKARLILDGKIKKEKPLAAITDDEPLFGLPKGWVWCQLGNVCSYIQRGKGPDYVENSDFLVISQKCVRWAGLDLAQVRFVNPESFGKYEFIRSLCEGDVLWNSTGTGTIGRACLVPPLDNKKILVADSHVTVVRPIIFSELYLLRWIQSPSVQSKIEGLASGTTNQIELNTSTVIAHLFPLPPLAEQHRIVAKVDELMVLCDQLEAGHAEAVDAHEKLVSHLLATLTASQDSTDFSASWQRIAAHFDMLFTTEASIDALKQTLLQLAVMGKLVPQDSNDEPASVMLKRYEVSSIKATSSGWCHVPLGKLGVVYGGATPSKAKHEYWAGTIPWVSPKDMKRFYIDDAEDSVSENAVSETSLKIIPSGSLLMVVRGMILAHSFPVALTTCEVTINQDMKALLIPDEIKEYMLLYLRAMKHVFVGLVDRSSHGTCKIISEKLWAASVTIPPKKEQDRIAAKVDELMALCDRMKKRIADAGALQRKLADVIVAQAVA